MLCLSHAFNMDGPCVLRGERMQCGLTLCIDDSTYYAMRRRCPSFLPYSISQCKHSHSPSYHFSLSPLSLLFFTLLSFTWSFLPCAMRRSCLVCPRAFGYTSHGAATDSRNHNPFGSSSPTVDGRCIMRRRRQRKHDMLRYMMCLKKRMINASRIVIES